MPDKQSFFQSINKDTIFDENFFKKIYGYSVSDNQFLGMVANKLSSIGKKEAIQAYNGWFEVWQAQDRQEMKKVAGWYIKEFDRQFELWQKEEQERMVKECRKKEMELLMRKKILLLTKKSMQLTGS